MHHKRKKPKTQGRMEASFPSGTPSKWNILFHTRPRRRRDKSKAIRILKGFDPDNMAWDLGNSRPHKYYW